MGVRDIPQMNVRAILFFMLAAMQAGQLVTDGDPAFYRVDTRTPAHELPKGVVADAVNQRFEDGRAWPRLAVQQGAWGWAGHNLAAGLTYNHYSGRGWEAVAVAGFVVGQTYYFLQGGNAQWLDTGTFGPGGFTPGAPGDTQYAPGAVFVAQQTTYYLNGQGVHDLTGTACTALIIGGANECGSIRFTDPNGYDTLVVATDEWRNGPGEDGGRGRVWKILANNAPVLVPLNGQDIYGSVQLVPCNNALVLLRADNERHYFEAANVGEPGAGQIQLNGAPSWNTGEQVFFWADPTQGSSFNGTSAPANMSFCFVRNVGNNVIKLYADSNLTQQLQFTSGTGRFYLERRAAAPGLFGNVAPPLLAQPSAAGNSLWETGFGLVPANVTGTGNASTNVWTAVNHRFVPGDNVALTGMAGGDTPANGSYYAYPVNVNQFYLFDTQAHALAAANGSTAGVKAIAISNGSVPVFAKVAASGLPMPPAAGGFYTETNRLVLFNGNTLMISDPLDPLHYSPMSATITANLGESDAIMAVCSFISADCVVILKRNSILALYNFSGGPTAWVLRSVTREYGCVAPRSVKMWGSRLLFVSRRGLDQVEFNAFGTVLPKDRPISWAMKKYTDRIDWANAGRSTVETWNSRLFWAVPLRGPVNAAGTNNTVLTLNFLNSNPEDHEWGWEGQWTGLQVKSWARHTVNGEERLALVNSGGQVFWLADGSLDAGNQAISTSLTTRVYAGGNSLRKVWQSALLVFDHNHPNLTVQVQTPGYNSATTLTPAGGLTYAATNYVYGGAYDPATQTPPFTTPGRDDYAIQAVTELVGGVPDVLQNKSEPFRMRQDAWGVQFVLANTSGQVRWTSIEAGGFYGPASERKRV